MHVNVAAEVATSCSDGGSDGLRVQAPIAGIVKPHDKAVLACLLVFNDRTPDRATSARMSKVRNEHTEPELIVHQYLHAVGFRYRLYNKTLLSKPDVVLSKDRAVVFVQRCFWHGHGGGCLCQSRQVPKTNTDF